jgi:hypothetical protein
VVHIESGDAIDDFIAWLKEKAQDFVQHLITAVSGHNAPGISAGVLRQ